MPILPVFRPNTVSIDRRAPGAATASGSRTPAITRLNSSVPALIDSAAGGDAQFMVEGQVYTQDAELFMDGLHPAEFAGAAPGDTIDIGGVTYTVAANGQSAFPDLKLGDRVTDNDGITYLTLATSVYYGPFPSVEAKLCMGRAWVGPAT